MRDIEGIEHEIGCLLEEAQFAWNAAKDQIKDAESWQAFSADSVECRPLKMAAKISGIIEQFEAAHKFLTEAARMQRERDEREAA